MTVHAPRPVKAVLGPTNTGKTYLAIDRMLGHASGMIGFPLRLLARENYDRVVQMKGAAAVALITGEERIVPANPRYFLCTVEAMPLDLVVDFLAIDEVQLCADPERGHVFTNRVLHARGREETMLLGAETMAPIIRRLIPDAQIERRERFSKLSYGGFRKLTRLPPRSAIVAFSAANVYALAELLRRQCGGTAVVLGALSPRTRNAQVAMYEAGEVDYLVATDAIGMGLNMGITHVGFSAMTKFDGHGFRRLLPSEVGQIAGRAGRYMEDGTFGPTADLEPFEPELVAAVEAHEFDPVESIFWRNANLDYYSADALKRSLEVPPSDRELRRTPPTDDYNALLAMREHADIKQMATNPEAVHALWDTCRIPDFSGDLSGNHTRLVARIYRFLMADAGRISSDWIERSIGQFDRTDGDIDTLMARIAGVRTWSYISHRQSWLDDPDGLQARARELEDKLSDALHECLTQRFVDRKASVITRGLREKDKLLAGISDAGMITVEGEEVGRLDGFRFAPLDDDVAASPRLMAAANRAVRESIGARIAALAGAEDEAFTLDRSGARIIWKQAPVARLTVGADILHPLVEVLPSDLLDVPSREDMRVRLQGWLEATLGADMAPLFALTQAKFSGSSRALAFRLSVGLGCAARVKGDDPANHLTDDERKALAKVGIRIGVASVYLPTLLKGRVMELKAMLYRIHANAATGTAATTATTEAAVAAEALEATFPDGGATAMPRSELIDDLWYLALGFCPAGPVAVRADELERLLAAVRRGTKDGMFTVSPDLLSRIDATADVFARMIRSFGYAVREEDDVIKVTRRAAKRRPGKQIPDRQSQGKQASGKKAGPPRKRGAGKPGTQKAKPAYDPDSPFAALAVLKERGR
jgi:ATP-dependent RNA helicase SUPV3L1/SUV3